MNCYRVRVEAGGLTWTPTIRAETDEEAGRRAKAVVATALTGTVQRVELLHDEKAHRSLNQWQLHRYIAIRRAA